MDAISEIRESKNELRELISGQREEIDGRTAEGIMRQEVFSTEALKTENVDGRMGFDKEFRMVFHRLQKGRYQRELLELEKKQDTPEGMIAYLGKKIQLERSDMEMRLIMASVLGRRIAADRIRVESLEKMIKWRLEIIEYYRELSGKGVREQDRREQDRRERNRELQETEQKKEEAVYQEAVSALNPRVLIVATIDQVKAERAEGEKKEGEETQEKSVSGWMREFLSADFSEQALEAGYVMKNLHTCLHNVELIRRLRRMAFTGEDAARVTQKLEAVSEYENVVESALWDYGLTVDFHTLQVKEIRDDDEVFARKRQRYLANGALRFCLAMKRYRQSERDGEASADVRQQESRLTRVEEKLSALETELGMQRDEKARITRTLTRSVGRSDTVQTGDTIRADAKHYMGKMEHLQVKVRLLRIYREMKRNLEKDTKGGAKAFASLEEVFKNYVLTNRIIWEDRKEAETKEADALKELKKALAEVQGNVMNQSSRYAAILLGLLTEENDGYLEVPPGEIQVTEDDNIVLGNKRTPGKAAGRRYQDRRNTPLFTHRPNSKDIRQGGLGDCYLLAGLLSVVERNPEEIMNIMRDNGDGTVTVCFKPVETDAAGREIVTPYYVTVRKTIPVENFGGTDAFSQGALWVKMMEKAYAASKLHLLEAENREREERREASLAFSEWKENGLQAGQGADYDDIWGGYGGRFISLLLGKKSSTHVLVKNRAEHVGNRICRMLPPVNEPAWKPSPARKFGKESVDSIVYEYIKKQEQRQKTLREQLQTEILLWQFLYLKKPEAADREDDAVMTRYRADKEALQKYRRTCSLNLDIVDTLAKEKGEDVLQMNTEEQIRRWYQNLKDWYSHYCNRAENDPLSDEDKIIERTLGHYAMPDFGIRFLPHSELQFNDTVDILQHRHLVLLHRNQAGGQGTEAGDDARAQEPYYSARDLKLFQRIEDALRAESDITLVTRQLAADGNGLNGESMNDGMVGSHVYSVINTQRVTVNGQQRFYFVLINPWAEQGVVYDVNADGTRERSVRGITEGEKQEGVFYLDLKRVAEIVERWDSISA